MLELQTCRLDQWRSQRLALDVRLKRLLDTIPLEVQTDGISLEAQPSYFGRMQITYLDPRREYAKRQDDRLERSNVLFPRRTGGISQNSICF